MRLILAGLFLAAFGLLPPSSVAQEWKIVGPGGGGTTIAPTISPHDPSRVAIHCDMTGGYITSDQGQSWRMVNLRGAITTFAFDPVQPDVIYAGNAALWRSTDSGRTWSMLFPNPADGTLEHQLGDHSDYALTTRTPGYPGGEVSAIAIAPAQGLNGNRSLPARIYVSFKDGAKPARIVFSPDAGEHWKPLASVPEQVRLLLPQLDGLLVIAGSAAYRVSENGETVVLGHLPAPAISASAGLENGLLHLYATAEPGRVYTSADDGRSWKDSTPALGQSSGVFGAIAASAQHGDTAYVGFRGLQLGEGKANLYNGIAKTSNGGSNWTIVFKESNHPATNLDASWIEQRATQDGDSIWFDAPYSLGAAPSDAAIAYASDLFRTYRTLDGGQTWAQVNSAKVGEASWVSRGLDVTTSYGVQFDPFDKRHVFIDTTDIGLFQSSNGGRSWQSSSEGVPESWRNTTYWLAFDPARRGLIWGAFSGTHDLPRPKMWRHSKPEHFTGGVAVSHDGGLHWTPSNQGMPSASITHILLDPESAPGKRTLYACAFGRGVYKSVDNGRTWTLKNNGIQGAEPFAWRITAAQAGKLYLVVSRRGEKLDRTPTAAGALYVSTDHAEHWRSIPLPEGVTGPTGLEVDAKNPQRLYLTAWGQEGADSDHNGGVYISEDGGASWRPSFTASQHVYDLTIDPANPDHLYITGFDAAAFRSLDRGAHWERIPGFDFKWSHRIFFDPSDSSQIYIATYGGGVWHGPAAGTPRMQETIRTAVPIAH